MKTDIYQEITDYIVTALEKIDLQDIQAPFAQLASTKPPMNPTTEKCYNGINTVFLWFKQYDEKYSSNEWATYQQWKEKGAQVKKGEKSSKIIFYKQVEKKDENAQAQDEKEFYNMVKSYSVFNADQVDGYEAKTGAETGIFGTVESIEAIEAYIAKTKAIVKTGENAFYSPVSDDITMPEKSLFFGNGQDATENYYAVLLHELTHWTGAKHRLDREQSKGKAHEAYAFEELIAELGSAFLCSKFDIKQEGREDHALYIKSWLRGLKNDKKYIFKASAQAQKAVDYLSALTA